MAARACNINMPVDKSNPKLRLHQDSHQNKNVKNIFINMSKKLRPISDYVRKKELSTMLISTTYIKIMEIAEPFCK